MFRLPILAQGTWLAFAVVGSPIQSLHPCPCTRPRNGAIMTISDESPSFQLEATEKAEELEDKRIMKSTVAIAEPQARMSGESFKKKAPFRNKDKWPLPGAGTSEGA